jgi:FixJ family two-component response regulator
MPVVFLAAHGDVPSTVHAMKAGAIDFLVKPVDEQQLFDAINRALNRADGLRRASDRVSEAKERFGRLTTREREVCELVASGLLNRQIASELGTSEKTVKIHRRRVMQKLEVTSIAELVRLLGEHERHERD